MLGAAGAAPELPFLGDAGEDLLLSLLSNCARPKAEEWTEKVGLSLI